MHCWALLTLLCVPQTHGRRRFAPPDCRVSPTGHRGCPWEAQSFCVSSLARGPRVTPGCVSPMLRAVGSHWDCRRHAAASMHAPRPGCPALLPAPQAGFPTLRSGRACWPQAPSRTLYVGYRTSKIEQVPYTDVVARLPLLYEDLVIRTLHPQALL